MLFLRTDNLPLTPYPCIAGDRAKPECTSRVSPPAILLGACQALGVPSVCPLPLLRPLQELQGEVKGQDSIWLEPRSGKELCELSLPILGTDKLKARVKTNPDLNPCAFCSCAPFSCPINYSSHHLTFCYLMKNVSGLLPRQTQ